MAGGEKRPAAWRLRSRFSAPRLWFVALLFRDELNLHLTVVPQVRLHLRRGQPAADERTRCTSSALWRNAACVAVRRAPHAPLAAAQCCSPAWPLRSGWPSCRRPPRQPCSCAQTNGGCCQRECVTRLVAPPGGTRLRAAAMRASSAALLACCAGVGASAPSSPPSAAARGAVTALRRSALPLHPAARRGGAARQAHAAGAIPRARGAGAPPLWPGGPRLRGAAFRGRSPNTRAGVHASEAAQEVRQDR